MGTSTSIDADTLLVRFSAQLDSFDQLKSDFKGTAEAIDQMAEKFEKRLRTMSGETTRALKNEFSEREKAAKESMNSMSASTKEIASAVGLGNIGGMLTGAGIALSLMSFAAMMMKIKNAQIVATQMLTGAGSNLSGTEQIEKFGSFQAQMRTYLKGPGGIPMSLGTPEEVAKVSGRLLSTPGMKGANLFGTKPGEEGLALQSLLMGKSTGLGSDMVSSSMANMVGELGVPAKKAASMFKELYERGQDVNNVDGEYIRTVLSISDKMKAFGTNVETVSGLTSAFWDDIRLGKVTIDELIKTFEIGKTATRGQLAYMGENILAKSPIFADQFKAGMNPLLAIGITGDILQGVKGQPMRNAAISAIGRNLFDTAAEKAGSKDPRAVREMIRLMSPSIAAGMASLGNNEEQDKMINWLQSGMRSDTPNGKKYADILANGVAAGKTEQDPLKRIGDILENIERMLGGFFASAIIPAMPEGKTKQLMIETAVAMGIPRSEIGDPGTHHFKVHKMVNGHMKTFDQTNPGPEGGSVMDKAINKQLIEVAIKLGFDPNGHPFVTKKDLKNHSEAQKNASLSGNVPISTPHP